MRRSAWWMKFLFLLPLLIGVLGFAASGQQSILDAVFKCVTMYVLNYGDTPPNILVEFARWTAPLATASGAAFAVSVIREKLINHWKYFRGNSVAVYGSDEEKLPILAQLGKRGINGQTAFLQAKQYILLNSEHENFSFYQKHQKKLQGRSVYILSTLPAQSASPANLNLFCPEEIAARLYWRQRNLYSEWLHTSKPMRIVLLGFGQLGKELIYSGLQNNVFSPTQCIEYHVFGDCSEFLAVHTSLDLVSDIVIRHDEPWYQNLALLEDAAFVLVLEQEGQPALLQTLLSTIPRRKFDVFSGQDPALFLLDQQERLYVFPWKNLARELKYLMDDTLSRQAKCINMRYCHLYTHIEENAENTEREWNRLDAFTRYSNISAADYNEIRMQMIRTDGLSTDSRSWTSAEMERFAELEHIRWCRYHLLNNWRPGTLPDGKTKDSKLRIHSLLYSYEMLSDSDKEKDRENIRILLALADK